MQKTNVLKNEKIMYARYLVRSAMAPEGKEHNKHVGLGKSKVIEVEIVWVLWQGRGGEFWVVP